MTFGETTSEEDGHYQLDESVASGINFIDTAEMYPTCPLRPETTGDTEIIVGNWISKNKYRRSFRFIFCYPISNYDFSITSGFRS